jgi:hypothetical protein
METTSALRHGARGHWILVLFATGRSPFFLTPVLCSSHSANETPHLGVAKKLNASRSEEPLRHYSKWRSSCSSSLREWGRCRSSRFLKGWIDRYLGRIRFLHIMAEGKFLAALAIAIADSSNHSPNRTCRPRLHRVHLTRTRIHPIHHV